ncbi:hypothetical protein C8R43DRAFT_960205 [Mycena crocata]|nr:hypothetical protein C8R43DRAFT_960205 [Mycena crocata]
MHTSTKRLSCNHGTLWVHPANTLGASTERAGCTHRTPWVHPPNALGAPTEHPGCIHRTRWVHPPNALGASTEHPGCTHRTLGATTGATMGAPTNPRVHPELRWVHPRTLERPQSLGAPRTTLGAPSVILGAPTVTLGAPTVCLGAPTAARKKLPYPSRSGCCPMFVHPKPRAAKKIEVWKGRTNQAWRIFTVVHWRPMRYARRRGCLPSAQSSVPINSRTQTPSPPFRAHTLPSGANLLRDVLPPTSNAFQPIHPSHNPPYLSLRPRCNYLCPRFCRIFSLNEDVQGSFQAFQTPSHPELQERGQGRRLYQRQTTSAALDAISIRTPKHLAALRALELKVGHTSWLPRRVTQYRGCQSGAQKIVWYGYFSAQRRMHVERRVHMALERRGIHPVRGECAGDDCNTDHKEYFPMLLIRRFSRLLRIVRDEMVLAQEVDLKLWFL